MGIALKLLENEIEDLADMLGFDLPLEEHGICSVELENDFAVMLSISPDSERYSMHCLLLEAPASHGEGLLLQAMQINLLLDRDALGTLAYSDADDAIVYSWTGRCGEHRREKNLGEEFDAFVDSAAQLRQLLLEEAEEASGGASQPRRLASEKQARFALLGMGV